MGCYGQASRRRLWARISKFGVMGGLLVLLLLAAVACGGVPVHSAELHSTKERATPSAVAADLNKLASGNNTFAFDLYQGLALEAGNLFFSPYSISLALAMTYAGASGETENQMADTLRFHLSQDMLHATFNVLDMELASRGEGARGKDGEGFRLNIANAVWGQQGYEFLETFLDVLAENYGAGLKPVDFAGAPEESRLIVNDWVAERTEDRIKDLIRPGVIDEFTRMVLTNAIYFNAAWSHPFAKHRTTPRSFHLLDGSSVEVPMMSTGAGFGYAKGDGYQSVDLPYASHELSMTIMLPDLGRFGEFEDSLDAALASRIIEALGRRTVNLDMPRFEFDSQFQLAETLKAMGMPDAFDSSASDFSGMDGKSCLAGDQACLYIGDIIHKAFVSVDEEGTEAAAATAVEMAAASASLPTISVTIDRPFIFLIRDRATNTILFVGRVEKI